MAEKKEIKVMSLTNYLIELPNPRITTTITILASIIVGIIGYPFFADFSVLSPESIVLYGCLLGIFLIALPALFASVLVTGISLLFKKNLIFRRSCYLSLFSVMIVSIMFLIGSVASPLGVNLVFDLLIFGYILIFATRIFILTITYPYNMAQTVLISAVHPILGLIFMYSPFVLDFFKPIGLPLISPEVLAIKALISFAILGTGAIFFVILINAPMKRNFNLSSLQLTESFLSHWLDKTKTIEDTLKPMSEETDVLIGMMAFKSRDGVKSIFVIPYVHPGPFGEVGGSNITRIFTNVIESRTDTNVLIPHGIATHDLNPLETGAIYGMAERVLSELKTLKYSTYASKSVRNEYKEAKILGQKFGSSAFLVSTFSPNATEDIDFSIGLAVMNKLERDFKPVLYVDAHNCHQKGHHTIFSGDAVVFDLMKAMSGISDKLVAQKMGKLKMGVGVDPMRTYSPQQGVGYAGLRVAVIEVSGQRTAYVLFDANNMAAGLREKIIDAVRDLKINEVEVMTTDSHHVNNIRGVENPIGWKIDQNELIERAVKTTKRALENLEPVSVGSKIFRVEKVRVLGAQKAAELISTVSSMIAIMKIVSPLLFGSALFFSLLSILLIT